MKFQRTRVSAYGLIYDAQNILLCRLSNKLPDREGHWTLPGGGIEFGESPQEAMVREVKEETGLDVDPLDIAFVDSIVISRDSEEFHGIRIVFNTIVMGGEISCEVDGTTDLPQFHPLSSCFAFPLVKLAEVGVKHALENPKTA